MVAPKLLKKISYKTVCGKVNRREIPEGGAIKVMRVIGQATDIKSGNSDYGMWNSFLGNFEATNVRTGEVFRSGQIFLPGTAENLLMGAVKGAAGAPVAFGFDISVVDSPDSQISYEYGVESIMDVSETDPIALLKQQMTSAPALPAPTKTEAVSDATVETEAKPKAKK